MSEANIKTIRQFRQECRSYGEYLQAFAGPGQSSEIQLDEPLSGEKEKVRQILKVISMVPMPS